MNVKQFSIICLLRATVIVACFCAFWQLLSLPGVLVKRVRETEEFWFEHDAQVWTDRQLREWGMRK